MRKPPASDLDYDPTRNTRPAWIDNEPAPPDPKSGDYSSDFPPADPSGSSPTSHLDYFAA